MKFIHLSDLHFHRNNRDNTDIKSTLQYIKDRYPDHKLIVTGDIVDDGHQEQYNNAYRELQAFKGRVFVAPGNHDFGAAGNFYSRERAERFDDALSIPLEQGGTFSRDNTPVVNILEEKGVRIMLIALDTNLETEHPFDFACGEVGTGQLGSLTTILANSKTDDLIKVLFFHHHPFWHNNPFLELKDAADLTRTIYGKIDVLLFGHKHVMNKWESCNGIQYVLASDNSPGKEWARELTIDKAGVSVKDLRIAKKTRQGG